jgi:hypothetical protein
MLQRGPLSLTPGVDFPRKIVEVLLTELAAFFAEWRIFIATVESVANQTLSPM